MITITRSLTFDDNRAASAGVIGAWVPALAAGAARIAGAALATATCENARAGTVVTASVSERFLIAERALGPFPAPLVRILASSLRGGRADRAEISLRYISGRHTKRTLAANGTVDNLVTNNFSITTGTSVS